MLRTFATVLMLALAPALLAQGQYATVSGVVTDSSGAIAPDVTVRVVNTATGENHIA